ncbi:hypothetical protein SKAU_G00091580 [Synaphobranchus kaupii]|uniref:Uncharacterized protein n=1 Tax=Synaphobranchus kaupii TaxID=118154 RepID=A0A9Q1FXM8_SYNKA|nr:hypothetical protein SKAU_G00091580 [Synaphobranchus kaupii]
MHLDEMVLELVQMASYLKLASPVWELVGTQAVEQPPALAVASRLAAHQPWLPPDLGTGLSPDQAFPPVEGTPIACLLIPSK